MKKTIISLIEKGKFSLPALALALAICTSLSAQVNKLAYEGKYHDITIPANTTSKYLILTAVGGDAGMIQQSKTYRGGQGALVQAGFPIGAGAGQLAPGGTIRFMVGGHGESHSDGTRSRGSGGGGGTGIAYRSPAGKWTLLVVAGGGGGAAWAWIGDSMDGDPGQAYKKDFIGYGGAAVVDGKSEHSGAGAFGASTFFYSGSSSSGSEAGWVDGPQNGAPTGGGAHANCTDLLSGGWGFGAGGLGIVGDRRGGGGGGYTGGNGGYYEGKDNTFEPPGGGLSYVNEDDMSAGAIVSYERGVTGNPANGYATYEYSNTGNAYNVMHYAQNQNKCMDVPGGHAYAGANVQLWDCNNGAAQNWTFDWVMVKYAQDPSLCLELSGSTAKNGANIDTWGCNVGANAQKWIYDGINKSIRSRVNPAYCIDLVNGITTNGNNIQLYQCKDVPAQQWIVDRATIPVISQNYNRIKLAGDPGKCVDLVSGNTTNGTNIQIYYCHDHPAQYWYFTGNSIRLNKDRNKCLDLSQSNTSNGANIQLYDCNGTNAQQWVYDGMARSFRSMINPDKCIDVDHSNFNDGINIQLWDCNGTSAQQFVIE